MNSMRYNFIFYDEKILGCFLLNLSNAKGKNITQFNYAYIYHDKDIMDNGELKKPHYHLWLEFNSAVKSMYIDNILQLSGSNSSALSHQKTDRNFLAYLTHENKGSKKLGKAIYNFEDIKTNIDIDIFKEMYYNAIEKLNKPTSQQKNEQFIKDIIRIVAENKDITCFPLLTFFLYQNEQYELLEYCTKRAYGLKQVLQHFFATNSMKCSQVFENEKIEQIEGGIN